MVVIIIFYIDICMKLALSTSISTMNNDNISLDVFHKFFMINISQLFYDKNIMLVREKKQYQINLGDCSSDIASSYVSDEVKSGTYYIKGQWGEFRIK